MPALSPLGSSLPNSIGVYDFKATTFTVAQGANASPYEITNSRKEYTISSAKNLAAMINDDLFDVITQSMSALRTTNSTDDYTMVVQYSGDDGATWQTINPPNCSWTGGGGANIPDFVAERPGTITEPPNYPLTGNKILFRTVITHAAAPTTDAFTLTNIRVTMMFNFMAP